MRQYRFVHYLSVIVVGWVLSVPAFAYEAIVIDKDDRVEVKPDLSNVPEDLHPVIASLGVLARDCTVAHIGGGLVLTAGHCVQKGRQFKKITNVDCQDRDDLTVEFGYLGDHAQTLKAKCVKILLAEYHATDTDYAVLKVSDAPKEQLALDFKVPQEGTEITVFSHPHREPLNWSGYCSVEKFTAEECEKADLNCNNYFKHSCDTDQGSSGAPMIDIHSLKIVGIHDGGQRNINGNFALTLRATSIQKLLQKP